MRTYNLPIDLLLLCTANQCRSPMAEVLLQHRLDGIDASVRVSSAGSLPGGRPATAHGQEVMAARGLDLSAHQSRQLDGSLIDGAHLIIGMAREHVREVASLRPEALDRSFTLKELVRMAAPAGPRHREESVGAWLSRVSVARRRSDLVGIGNDPELDIADPIGRGIGDYEKTADEIDGLLALLVDLVWPLRLETGRERSA